MNNSKEYPYNNIQDFGPHGYRLICTIFGIISRVPDKKAAFYKAAEKPENHDKDAELISWLNNEWNGYSQRILKKISKDGVSKDAKEAQSLLTHYNKFHWKKGTQGHEIIAQYKDKWVRSPDWIIGNRCSNRDPNTAMGIAMTIALGMLSDEQDVNFYIGKVEAKKILFSCLDYFGYQDVIFIPEQFFSSGGSEKENYEKENLRKLLFSSIFCTLMFLYPKKNEYREGNWNNGRDSIFRVVQSDSNSDLYKAFNNVAESKKIASQLWKSIGNTSEYLDTVFNNTILLSNYYQIPIIASNNRLKIMSCEKGQAIRSLIEGKSGCGKSTLARIIAQLCQSDVDITEPYATMANLLDFRWKMLPITLNCKLIQAEDIKEGVIVSALRQMLKHASESGEKIEYDHYYECEKYIEAFCYHKTTLEELLLIIDDYKKIPPNLLDQFNDQLERLCQNRSLHIIIFTDKLKPSAKTLFLRRFNEFAMSDISVNQEQLDLICDYNIFGRTSNVNLDIIVQKYINTPRRLMRYVKAIADEESIFDVIQSCIEEELETKKCFYDDREEYLNFIRGLTLYTLKNRKETDKANSVFFITEKNIDRFIRSSGDNEQTWRNIWSCIDIESVMFDRDNRINSIEFGTSLYLYHVLAEYYLEMLDSSFENYYVNRLTEEFSYLSGPEFAHVLLIMFNRLHENQFRGTSEDDMECFMQAIVGRLFMFDSINDIEYCKWAVSQIITEENEKVFVYNGIPMRRQKTWNMIRRAYLALDICMDVYRDNGLISS